MSRRHSARRASLKTALTATTVLLIVSIAVYFWFASAPQQPPPEVVIDWRLKITIHNSMSGANYTLPSGIGVKGGIWNNHTLDTFGPPGYAPISTRDSTGTIYIQTTQPRYFNFGDFFNIWGVPFDKECVPDGQGGIYCNKENPPVMSDGGETVDFGCIDRNKNLSANKDWIIFLWSQAGRQLSCVA